MEPYCRIELLGGLRAQQGERSIARFRSQKVGALLAYLAYHRDRSHSRETLIEVLWPEYDLDAGRNNLSVTLSSLRHYLEPPGVPAGAVIVADRSSVGLNPVTVSTDVADFLAGLRAAEQADSPADRALSLADAAELYRGPLLAGYYEEWIGPEQQHLAERYFQALGQLAGHFERGGDFDRALDYAARSVSADPLREEAHAELVRLYAAAGQPAQALRQYRELVRILKAEFDSLPSAATRVLGQKVHLQAESVGGEGEKRKEKVGRPRAPASCRTPDHPNTRHSPPSTLHSPLTAPLPTGTVTFLLTDIEGSTELWQRAGDAFRVALETHHAQLRREFGRHGGHECKEAGDGFIVAFHQVADALACAVACQRALDEQPWPEAVGPLRVRMALHTGDVELKDGEYHGLMLHHAARLLVAGHGGQILCSEVTAMMARSHLPPGVRTAELGVYRLRDLPEPTHLFQVDYPAMQRQEFPRLRAESGYSSNLPLQVTRFFGRVEELAHLTAILRSAEAENEAAVGSAQSRPSIINDQPSTRLVTLTGPGGTGKTRLALEAARRLVEPLDGAVWFIPLADLSDADRMAEVIRDGLRLPRLPNVDPLEQVVEALCRQPSLLVLDNLEQLLPGGATVIHELRQRIPHLICLVTSRQRLDLEAEQELPVPALPTPAGASWAQSREALVRWESVQLFVDRAQIVRPDFQVTPSNAAAVAELCERLEGMPLAIELAAARAQVLTPAQMVSQLERRFDLLVSRRRDLVERHRTLRGTIDWSYGLLALELQRFFACLSVFRGGWTLEAAEAVCAESPTPALDALAQLQECSLIRSEEAPGGMRFGMLESLREYGREILKTSNELEAVERRHTEYFLRLAEESESGLRGHKQSDWLAQMDQELDNLRAALETCDRSSDSAEGGLRLAAALHLFWDIRAHHSEGRQRLQRALALPGAIHRTVWRARALTAAAMLAADQNDWATVSALSGESLAILRELGETSGMAAALLPLGWAAQNQSDLDGAGRLFDQSLALYRDAGDRWGVAFALHWLGGLARLRGDSAAARAFYEESLRIAREIGDRRALAFTLVGLADLTHHDGDLPLARKLYEESQLLGSEIGDRWSVMFSASGLGEAALRDGDLGSARSFHEEALEIARTIGRKSSMSESLYALGQIARLEKNWQAARDYYAASLEIAYAVGYARHVAAAVGGIALTLAAAGDAARAAPLLGAAMSGCPGVRFHPSAGGESKHRADPSAARAPYSGRAARTDSAELRDCEVALRATLGDKAFEAAVAVGRAMTLSEAVAAALSPLAA